MKFINSFFIVCLIILTFSCGKDDTTFPDSNSDTGVAGSYARFIIVGDFMYIVDDTSIKTFDLNNPEEPVQLEVQNIGERIESIFEFDNNLFIGSGAGLFIYEIQTSGLPVQLSATEYFDTFNSFRCDPVVANDTYAYVTLNSLSRLETNCGDIQETAVNVLKIYNIEDLTAPDLIAEYEMFAPKGVGLDGTTLFICDDSQGLKIYDVSEPTDIQLIKQVDDFTAFDVIPLNGLLLVVGPENIYQFDYSDLENIQMISQIQYGS